MVSIATQSGKRIPPPPPLPSCPRRRGAVLAARRFIAEMTLACLNDQLAGPALRLVVEAKRFEQIALGVMPPEAA